MSIHTDVSFTDGMGDTWSNPLLKLQGINNLVLNQQLLRKTQMPQISPFFQSMFQVSYHMISNYIYYIWDIAILFYFIILCYTSILYHIQIYLVCLLYSIFKYTLRQWNMSAGKIPELNGGS